MQASVIDEFTTKVIERLKNIKAGCPLDPATELGSLINPKAAQRVEEQVAHTVKQGAKLVLGGKSYDSTYFEPTVLIDVITKDASKAMRTAAALENGVVVINGSGCYRNIDQPHGGVKMSGIGKEGICCTIQDMTNVKSYIMKNILLDK